MQAAVRVVVPVIIALPVHGKYNAISEAAGRKENDDREEITKRRYGRKKMEEKR